MKLQRAEEHFGQLKADHDRFIRKRNPYRMLREADPEPGFYIWRAKIVEPPPLEKWAAMAGECIHALRSALDHTAFQLVQIKRPSSGYSEFPIFKEKTGDHGWDARVEDKLPGIDSRVLAQVQWLQPYRRGLEYDPLWRIHRLDIIDKHRKLNLVSPLIRRAEYIAPGARFIESYRLSGPFDDGAAVARYRLTPEVDVKTKFTFDIAFGEGEMLAGEPVLETLERLRIYAGFVVARFDRFFV